MTATITYGPSRSQVRDLYFAKGLSGPVVAQRLGISRQRVYQHVAAIREREPGIEQEVRVEFGEPNT